MKINYIFPQTIGVAQYGKADDIAMRVAKHMNTSDNFLYNPHKLPLIEDLMRWIDHEVNEYRHGMQYHDYKLNTYQSWHSHAGNVISAVYIVLANPDTSSPLYFRNPVPDIMNPMNANMDPDIPPVDLSWYNSEQMAYPSIHGTLYIFRSYLEHAIKLKENTDRRIALALNYNRINRIP